MLDFEPSSCGLGDGVGEADGVLDLDSSFSPKTCGDDFGKGDGDFMEIGNNVGVGLGDFAGDGEGLGDGDGVGDGEGEGSGSLIYTSKILADQVTD